MNAWDAHLGATVRGNATDFAVWAPETNLVEAVIETPGRPEEVHALTRGPDGYHRATLPGISEGDLYRYRLDGAGPFPDPASRFQPLGVHGPSQIVDWSQFEWSDSAWAGIDFDQAVLYELHVGTFTPGGTFQSAMERLPYLKELGVTVVNLMPVGDFPGQRNWGYDGVSLFAPARCYGTPDDLRRFVNCAHELGLAVHLDVVYNHFGPDGAYHATFSRYYYSETHRSPWGAGINFDGPNSGPVRDFVIQNALRWIHEYHFDGLRLDATHAIVDTSPRHIVAALASAVQHSLKDKPRRIQVIAEDHRNIAALMNPESQEGWGLDGVWADDFHHQLRRALAGDADGYFQDFDGSIEGVVDTARQGWFYIGQHSPYFGHARGTDSRGVQLSKFVVFLQNHDQIGNRAMGERLHHQIDMAAWRAASVLLLMLPETPLLFMGQEWAANSPFLYFTDHHHELGRLVTEGRRKEFSKFSAFSDPSVRESIPDPQSENTFRKSRLNWDEAAGEPHISGLRLYRELLALRKTLQPVTCTVNISALTENCLLLRRATLDGAELSIVVKLKGAAEAVASSMGAGPETRELLLTTEDAAFAVDPHPARIDITHGTVQFERPGAVIFRHAQPKGDR